MSLEYPWQSICIRSNRKLLSYPIRIRENYGYPQNIYPRIHIRASLGGTLFSERELVFMFAICRRPSVCLSVCRLSSVMFVHPTQAIEIFGNVSAPCNTLVTRQRPGKILRRSSQGNPSVGGLNQRVVEKFSDFGRLRGYISETVQDRR